MSNKYVGKTCPYCKTAFKEDDAIVVCSVCDMPHHLSCWQENNGCTTFGCTGVIKDFIGKPEEPLQTQESIPQQTIEASKLESKPTEQLTETVKKQDRFETLYDEDKNILQKDSPVLIEKASLIIDHTTEKIMARCSFKCLTDKPIIAMMVDILCTDIWGKSLHTIEDFQFLDLKTKKDSSFGQTTPIEIPDKSTRSIDLKIKKILFSDRTAVDCGDVVCTFDKPQTLIDYYGNQNVADQYARETTKKAKYVAREYADFWQCTCGSINAQTESVCSSCNSDKNNLVAILADSLITERAATYLTLKQQKEEQEKKENEERIRLAEEQVKQEQAEKEKEFRAAEKKANKKKKNKKTLVVISIILIVIMALGAVGYFVGVPYYKYSQAMEMLDNGQYDKAYIAFKELKGFKDSDDMLDECQYQKGLDYLKTYQWVFAVNTFENISYYKNSKDKCNEAMYGYVSSHKNNDDKTTFSYLQTLKSRSYKDASSIYNSLYSWSVTAVINSSTTDSKTDKSTISRYNSVYCHFTPHGGTPGETIKIKYTIIFPNGSTQESENSWAMEDGETSWTGYADSIYVSPGKYSPTGYMYFKFYDMYGNFLGSDSVYIN